MKLQYLSDLHLEFKENLRWLEQHPIPVIADVLVIAGDFYYLGEDYVHPFLKKLAERFKQIYLVPGNHEFYQGYDLCGFEDKVHQKLLDNVSLVHNDSIYYGGVKLIFSTMWSPIYIEIGPIEYGITDYRRIRYKDAPVRVNDINRLHHACFEFIAKEVEEEGPKVVITHHLPSPLCTNPKYMNSPYNEAFCVDKTDFIRSSTIDYWIYGHNHFVKEGLSIGKTRLVSNQLGYVAYGEHLKFNPAAFIEI